MQPITEHDFDSIEFYDILLRGISVRADSAISDLVLDVDHIVDSWNNAEGKCEYMIAVADLTFHGVTGLSFSIDSGDRRYQVSIPGDWILEVKRELVVPQLVYFDRQYWRWQFTFALQTQLSFGAYGFTLRHRQAPVRSAEMEMDLAHRA